MPLSPRVTASTSLGIGSEVITMSAPLVTSAPDFAAVPPKSVQVFTAAGLRSNTVTWWLERLMMLRHMGPPMLPTPMNPTFMSSSPKLRLAHYIRQDGASLAFPGPRCGPRPGPQPHQAGSDAAAAVDGGAVRRGAPLRGGALGVGLP